MGRASLVCYAAPLIALLSVPANAQKLSKGERAAIAATPEQIADMASVRNDPLDTVITITTEPFFQERSGLLRTVQADKFVRVLIDKKTGQSTFQVYVWVTYEGDWHFADRVNYETKGGPVSAVVRRINSDVQSCTRYSCSKREDIAFNVPEADIREIAATAEAGKDQSWMFRIYGRTEGGTTTGILRTEVAGALIAADRERALLNK